MNDNARNSNPQPPVPGPCFSFWMGKFEAKIPTDRLYAKNHMWARLVDDAKPTGVVETSPNSESRFPNPETPAPARFRFGFSAYAVRLLQDVYFLDWHLDAPAPLNERQEIGEIESSKAESSLYSPIAGTLATINGDLLADPATINVDNYGRGWLFEIEGQRDALLSAEEYLVHLEAAWKLAERTIKGQMNEG
ncbi:MAG: glycine cleavage system protein H [Pirellulales bacterium]